MHATSSIEIRSPSIADAALSAIAVADDSGHSLLDVIAEMERFIVKDTKVGDARRRA